MKSKGLIVLSGGQDSTTAALIAKKECKELHGVTFDYGQKHKVEIKSAIKLAKILNFKSHEIINIPNILKSTSPLINKIGFFIFSGNIFNAPAVPNGLFSFKY